MTTAQTAEKRRAPLVRAALVPSLVAGVGCAVVFLLASGASGAVGAGLGMVLVIGFFWFGQAVLHLLRSIEPAAYLLIALLTYVLQIVVLLAVFAAFRGNDELARQASPTALAATVIVCTVVWTVGMIVAARRERTPLYDLGGHGS